MIGLGLGLNVRSARLGGLAPILDRLSVSPVAIYSLRKMRGAYTGFCIRVRRSSDNTELNIGFVNNVIDTIALLAFVGAGDGFVVTKYDQSGNAFNATQATAANQPRIVSAGVLDVQNAKACMRQVASQRWLTLPDIMIGASSATAVIVYSQATSGLALSGWGGVNTQSATNTHTPFSDGAAYDSFCSVTRQSFAGYGISELLRIHSMRHTGSALQCFSNGTKIDTDKVIAFKSTVANNRLLTGVVASTVGVDACMSESVFFGSAISTSDRQLLERDQGTYYGITVA